MKAMLPYDSGVLAPHPGAWIETTFGEWSDLAAALAPHPGAWIETWACDLQPRPFRLAPHPGAWIETLRKV